jgi:ABC-2 type transport system permease protein
VLTKPVTRTQFILSKYFAYLGMVAGVMILTTLAVVYDTIVLFDSSFNFGAYLLLNLTLFSYLAFLLAVIILCSSLFKNSVAAGGVAFLAYLVISTGSRFLPNWPKYLPQVVFDAVIPRSLLMGQGNVTDLLLPTIVGIVMAIITLIIACYIYEQREM